MSHRKQIIWNCLVVIVVSQLAYLTYESLFMNNFGIKEQYRIHNNYRQQFILKEIEQIAKGIKIYFTLLWRISVVRIIYHIKYNFLSRTYEILLLPCHLLLIFVRERGRKEEWMRKMYGKWKLFVITTMFSFLKIPQPGLNLSSCAHT
jgi:hypothetical protein